MTHIVRVDPSGEGIRRKGAGRGFFFTRSDGSKVTSRAELDRIRSLVIPPAWKEVWISPDERGHIQATGVDAAGRRQYIYHPDWTSERRAEKFERALALAWTLPSSRRRVTLDLRARRNGAGKALAAAFRLIDIAGLRIGNREYARENGTYGITTLEVRHARVTGAELHLCFVGKGGKQWDLVVDDSDLARVLSPMLKRSSDAPLLAYATGQAAAGRRFDDWQQLSAPAVNDYIRDVAGEDFSAKDLRTWRATVVAAQELPWSEARESSPTARQTQLREAVKATAAFLTDTPAVARNSYIDPRLVTAFLHDPPEAAPTTETDVRELLGNVPLEQE
ncbi:DNA topoisomerase IB [Brevibacterium renqingii]|uniref:DNA topoisomerase IB n=1 Tax=Brevibacterium renqingii TaxID=2776916 RepID=UPI001ADF8939|nr:DNA topoisomerase IB [Brevibacterium renqingii]